MDNLPRTTDSHDKERRSKVAFDLIVPDDLFLVRNEDGGDYGADKIIELKLNGSHMSNFRSYIQLKSTSLNASNDSITFSVPIKTLNYLVNQPNSLFVVYLEQENLFLWEWITEIVKYSASKGIEITTTYQKTIDFHFNKRLNRASFIEIHNEINTKGNIIKQFADFIKISNTAKTNISIDVSTRTVTSTEHIVQNIKEFGIALANEGKFSWLDEMLSQVPLQYKDDPDFAITVAYIKYCNGEYYQALSWIPSGTKLLKLEDSLKGLSEYLEMSIKYVLNLYSSDKYTEQFNYLLNKYPENLVTLQHKLYLYKDNLISLDPTLKEEHQQMTGLFNTTVEMIVKKVSPDSIIYIIVKMVEWELTGFQLLTELNFSRFNMAGRDQIGYPVSLQQRVEKANEYIQKMQEWMTHFELLYQSINDEVIKARVYTSFANLQMQYISNYQFNNDSVKSGNKILEFIKNSLEYNVEILKQNGYLHELFRAQMSLAECYMGFGLNIQAIDLVQNVKINAESVGLSNIVTYCNAFLEGYYFFNLPKLAEKDSKNKRYLSDLADRDLEMYARQMTELLEIPNNRYQNVLTEYQWLREDEIDKFQFCKFICTIQDLQHASSLETMYSINPNRVIICEKLGFQSPMGQNRDYLINFFKSMYCLKCELRKPLS